MLSQRAVKIYGYFSLHSKQIVHVGPEISPAGGDWSTLKVYKYISTHKFHYKPSDFFQKNSWSLTKMLAEKGFWLTAEILKSKQKHYVKLTTNV